MNPGSTSPPELSDKKVSTLIQPPQPTAGKLDAIVDNDGQTMPLRPAQDKLSGDDAAKKAAILDALPVHIALLNASGLIVAVNEAWRKFGIDNGLHDASYSVGVNYLGAFDAVLGDNADNARHIANSIRAVMGGEAKTFSVEYPCHSPTQQRWFQMSVTSLPGGHSGGAVVMHLDITGRKRSEAAMQRFGAAIDATKDAIYLVDRSSMRFVHVNDAACLMQSMPRERLLAMGPAGVLATSSEALEEVYDRIIATGGDAKPLEIQRQRKDGTRAWLELRRHAQHSPYGWTIATLVSDVTERKNASERIVYLNRVHAMLSGINTLIVRARDRAELFSEACRIAVEAGGFRMVWIGIVDSEAMKVVPVASMGLHEALLTAIEGGYSLDASEPMGNTMTARAIREKRPILSNNSQSDRNIVFGEKHPELRIRSMAILPLLVGDEAVGMIALHSGEAEFFHAEELKLLNQLAGHIALAIDYIDKRERLDYLAYYDVLTGLANRTLLLDRLEQHIRGADSAGHKLALFLFDIERFKNVNDSLGQSAGDALLRQVADWLTIEMGDANLLARAGSDQFAVVIPDVALEGDVARRIEKLMASLMAHPFRLDGAAFRIAAKVGIALFPDDGEDAEMLYRRAEAALKKTKTCGDRYLFFTHKMTATVAAKLSLENQLRLALEREEFVLHYQPKVDLVSGKLTGGEALIRWNDPQTGLVPPGKFIPVLEETGLICEVGRWALRQAVSDYLRWRSAGLMPVRVAVNVSPLQLRRRDFTQEIEKIISIDVHAAAGLELEITESLIMDDVKHGIASLEAIRGMAVCIAIDDFGTGFSSLRHLARMPVDTLKIDRSFVVEMESGPQGDALVATIVGLAHSLKLKVVAEGVDSEEQLRLLRLLKCDEMQGFLFSGPIPADIFAAKYLLPAAAA